MKKVNENLVINLFTDRMRAARTPVFKLLRAVGDFEAYHYAKHKTRVLRANGP